MPKSREIAAALMSACALFGLSEAAKADLVSTFTVIPGTINAGQQSTLDLNLTVTNLPSINPVGCLNNCPGPFQAPINQPSVPQFQGGSVTLYSGTGLSQTFTISVGGTIGPHSNSVSEDFQFSFTYPSSGTYSPSYQFTADYTQYQIVWFTIIGDGGGTVLQAVVTPGVFTDVSGQGSGSFGSRRSE
jgi:hypothetical protein